MADAQEPDPSRRRLLVVGGTALAVAACVGGYFLLRTPPEPEKLRGLGAYAFSNTEQVYLGNHRLARKPAVVDSSRVYAAIPEYQQIQREGLKPDVPKYHILLVKASERFNQAVKAAAAEGGYDVVAEMGTVKPANPANAQAPDITQATLAALR